MKHWMKAAVLDVMAQPRFVSMLSVRGGARCALLMLHRFRSADGSISGHDPARLRDLLAGLRRNKVALIAAADAIAAIGDPELCRTLPRLSVAFTVDDGYADLVEIGEPVFSEFDCPVTAFVVPGVVDGHCWFWWDQIDWIMRQSTARTLLLELQQQRITLQWTDVISREHEKDQLIERLKNVGHDLLLQFVAEMARAADVAVAIPAPARYRVLDWNELRAAERRGMLFGAHSMTHPILSQCSAEQSEYEIGESVRRVRQELAAPSSVFCYPNGRAQDFGMREKAAVRTSGQTAALGTTPGMLRSPVGRRADPDWRLNVPRFGCEEHLGKVTRLFLG